MPWSQGRGGSGSLPPPGPVRGRLSGRRGHHEMVKGTESVVNVER